MKNANPSTQRSLLAASALLLILSFFFPYWEALQASNDQAPSVQLAIYTTHSRGPLREQLAIAENLPRLEHSAFTAAGVALALLVVAAILAKRPWAALLCMPAMLLPAVICADALDLLAAGCSPAAACEDALAARAGAGALIAWGAAALLAVALLLELWKHAAPQLPARPAMGAGHSVLSPNMTYHFNGSGLYPIYAALRGLADSSLATEERMRKTLEAALFFTSNVRPPFAVLSS